MTTAMVFHKDVHKREAAEFVLSDWVRSRADALGVLIQPPSLEIALPIIKEYLPAKARLWGRYLPNPDSVEDWLQHILGIVCLVKIQKEVIAWGASTEPERAEAMRKEYSQGTHSKVRHALCIDYQWVLLFHPEYLSTRRDMFEAFMYERMDEPRLECSVVKC
jgi:hypothetical protein